MFDDTIRNMDIELEGDISTGYLILIFKSLDEEPKFLFYMSSPRKFKLFDSEDREVTDPEMLHFVLCELHNQFSTNCELPIPGGLVKIYKILKKMHLPIAYAQFFQDIIDTTWNGLVDIAEDDTIVENKAKQKVALRAIAYLNKLFQTGKIDLFTAKL